MSTNLDPTVLSVQQRAAVAADDSWGAGNLLTAAIGSNPHPELPLVHLARPLTDTDGQPLHELSLLELDRLAQSWSVWYLERGVKPRDRVAIYVQDSFAYSVHYFALSAIGAIGVLINSWAPAATANLLCQRTTPVGIYSDDERLERLWALDGCALHDMRWLQSGDEVPAPSPAALSDAQRFAHAGEDPVSILHSSGTTGNPKPVIQTHHTGSAGPRWRMTADSISPGERFLTSLPQSHVGAIAFTSYALLCGIQVIAMYDPRPDELLDAIGEYSPTSVMSFAHAYSDLAGIDLPAGALDSVERWVSVGDAVHEPHIRRLLAHRSEGLALSTFYDRLGSTELGWALLLHTSTIESPPKGRCAGRSTGAADVVVLRKDGSRAAPGELGLLGAKGPTITVGYWNDCDTTYRSKLGGYWLSGDVAYQDADGVFYQVDRAVDAIAARSGPGYSVLMEEVLLGAVPEICDCGVVGGVWGDETVAVALVRTTPGAEAEHVLRAANGALRAAGHPELALLEVARTDADYPTGVTGKVLKRVLRERYGDLEGYLAQRADRGLATAPPGTSDTMSLGDEPAHPEAARTVTNLG